MASGGRGSKMPHDNRVSSSSSLKMNDIWTKTIGYDPYATGEDLHGKEEEENARSAGLLLLAKMSNLSGSETRGACTRCGMVGHLTFQCRNTPKINVPESESDSSSSEEEKVIENPVSTKRRSRDHVGEEDAQSKRAKKKSRKDSKKKSKKKKKSRKSEK